MELKELIAKDLLKIKAVFFRPEEPFTWASGIKSPVYCDNRLTLTAPEVRTDVEKGLAKLVKEYYPEAEVLMGTSTAGIAHAAITAHLLDMPMGYVRSGAKDHGRQNQIEGRLEKGEKVVVVEDLISTGGSAVFGEKAMEKLKKNAVTVFIDVSPSVLKKRLSNITTRGIAAKQGESVEDILRERLPLYKKYADFTISTENENVESSVEKIVSLLKLND